MTTMMICTTETRIWSTRERDGRTGDRRSRTDKQMDTGEQAKGRTKRRGRTRRVPICHTNGRRRDTDGQTDRQGRPLTADRALKNVSDSSQIRGAVPDVGVFIIHRRQPPSQAQSTHRRVAGSTAGSGEFSYRHRLSSRSNGRRTVEAKSATPSMSQRPTGVFT